MDNVATWYKENENKFHNFFIEVSRCSVGIEIVEVSGRRQLVHLSALLVCWFLLKSIFRTF